jgi:hypothetical protein
MAPFAVFAVLARNLQRATSRFRRKSWAADDLESERTANMFAVSRCFSLFLAVLRCFALFFLMTRGIAKALPLE